MILYCLSAMFSTRPDNWQLVRTVTAVVLHLDNSANLSEPEKLKETKFCMPAIKRSRSPTCPTMIWHALKKHSLGVFILTSASVCLIIATTSVLGEVWAVGMVVAAVHESCLGYQGILCQ